MNFFKSGEIDPSLFDLISLFLALIPQSFAQAFICLARTLVLFCCVAWGHLRAKWVGLLQMKQWFVSLGPLCCLHCKDVITGISTEPFSGIVHLAGSMVSRTGEQVLALRTVLAAIALRVWVLPRGMNFVHVISHLVKSILLQFWQQLDNFTCYNFGSQLRSSF